MTTIVTAALIAITAAACGSSARSTSRSDGSGVAGTITVAAAASLSEAFTRIGHEVEVRHPGLHVRFDFDASSTLATRLEGGAPADVFAAADEATMNRVVAAGVVRARTPTVFARNRLEIVTKPGNPLHIRRLRDLSRARIVALCGVTVPCGRLAADVLEHSGVRLPDSSVTRAQNVKAALTAVADGDADAGLVYVTDVRAAGTRVTGVRIPASLNASTAYPIAVVRATERRAAAQAFVEAVLSRYGRRTLSSAGFRTP